ncbi:class I SAM-dependent methyltransferase [Hoeflea prorocentri]|uniref:Class I SAM-dependent methyltransferase n=1 Tax=Hoeflea prorocentri TaxID=1922333 RepID=A0A9X3UK14_9HYPH|nr:class I SAM-dependent methyltransferase [Hoeflea prorocentri]MCY6380241.1 class I SAM-dependent methyltransferase [Hoeflea prorocentri]MDA5398041.1 class I SAM-dependent methyltransferase [Hoeflea prorocentri]
MPNDIPSVIDLRKMDDARNWASKANTRPGRDEILDLIAEETRARASNSSVILELGSGPGFLAERLLSRIDNVNYVALDFSPAMHVLARERLRRFAGRVTFVERSFKSDRWTDGLGPFDVVVTNQAVHELRHKMHATALHRQVRAILKPAGFYLVSDHFHGEGGAQNKDLYMTVTEQTASLRDAGFSSVQKIASAGSLALHCAEKG